MNLAEKAHAFGLGLAISGLTILTVAVIYGISGPLTTILAGKDPAIGWVAQHSTDLGLIGTWLSLGGLLIHWNSEDVIKQTESKTRFVPYDELRELQTARRTR